MSQQSRPCPICKKPATTENRPFCSKRCADVDLNRWLGDGYVIPGQDGTAIANDEDYSDGGDEGDFRH